MKRVLVIGATGNVGSQVVGQLLHRGAGVTALTRNPGAASLPPGADLLQGDLCDPHCLDSLPAQDAAFLIWCAPLTTAPQILEKLSTRCGRIVFLSNMTVRDDQQTYDNRESSTHYAIERLISRSPSEWTFLRAGVFANNARLWWSPQIRSGNLVRWPYADARTAPIHERDIAAVAVRALLDQGHHQAKYLLTGPEPLSHRDQVRIIGEVLKRPIQFVELSPKGARAELFSKWPEPIVDMLMAAWPTLVGTPVLVTDMVEEVTGLQARTFREWVKDHGEAFQRDSI
jgi:uncharacterized protein YbjT (DUF2867 family)